jgi:hypothetical protein
MPFDREAVDLDAVVGIPTWFVGSAQAENVDGEPAFDEGGCFSLDPCFANRVEGVYHHAVAPGPRWFRLGAHFLLLRYQQMPA